MSHFAAKASELSPRDCVRPRVNAEQERAAVDQEEAEEMEEADEREEDGPGDESSSESRTDGIFYSPGQSTATSGTSYPLILIGLYGAKNAGKKSLAAALRKQLGGKAHVLHIQFSDPLINAASELFGVPAYCFKHAWVKDTEYYDETRHWLELRKGHAATPSELLAWFDAEIVQKRFGDTHMRRLLARNIARISSLPRVAPTIVIVSDVKTTDDALLLRDMGGKIIEVFRNGTSLEGLHGDNIISPSLIDGILINNGPKSDLARKFAHIDEASGCKIFSTVLAHLSFV